MPVGWLVLGDAASVLAAYFLAVHVRFPGGANILNVRAIERALPLFVASCLVLAQAYGLYERRPMTWPEQVQSLFLLVALDAVIGMAAAFFVRTFAVPRTVMAIAAVFDFLLLYAYRRAAYVAWMRRAGPPALVFVHALPAADVRPPQAESGAFRVAGVLSLPAALPAMPDGTARAARGAADGVLLDQSLPGALKEELALLAVEHGLELFIVPRLLDLLILRSRPALYGDRLVVNLTDHVGAGYQRALKRVVDVSLSVLFLVLTAPVLALAALAILVDDGSPVLYRQERLGLRGRPFQVLKLRTMRRDAEAATGPVLARRDDPRVTRVGRWLRHLHLDELPQLWNVLRGEMSLVGPRPERPAIHQEIAAAHPQFAARLRVLPGLTGLAQVHGAYDTHPAEKLKYDVLYSLRPSAAVDAQILLRTARNVLAGIGRAAGRGRR
jgi:exopolysaccharide biosynthesis polyprenyl glycosylphosphotransferase